MPVAQFNQFEKLAKPIMRVEGEDGAYRLWRKLSEEWNSVLDDVDTELIGQQKGSHL
jgi:hypothetical protein